MLEQITPVILTFNEEANIGRTLERLSWAKDIVIVDSYSTDATVAIASRSQAVRVVQRPFDTHAEQWNYAIRKTGIRTGWILALDADYLVTDEFLEELRNLDPSSMTMGYTVAFTYCIRGRALRGTLYPPVSVLYRVNRARYVQDGHTQRVYVDGPIGHLRSKLLHDDRKPLSRWLQAQDRYMKLEVEVVARKPWSQLSIADRVRRIPFAAPVMVFFYCLILKGGLLDGRAGIYYATQRMLAESLLSLRLIENKMGAS